MAGWIWRSCVVGAALAGLALPAWGAQATLAADAHVNSAVPGGNSGAISNLEVGDGYTTFMQFDLSLLPAGTTAVQVSRAVLRLYVNRVTTPGLVSYAPVTSGWGEYSVTYASQPGVGAAAGVVSVTQGGVFVAIDVTALVQGWVSAPGTNYGLALSAGTAFVQFDSKENDVTSHAATLDVELVDAGPVGPAGVPGSTGAVGPIGPVGPVGLTGSYWGYRSYGTCWACRGYRTGWARRGYRTGWARRGYRTCWACGEWELQLSGDVWVDDQLCAWGCGGVSGVELCVVGGAEPR